MEFKDFELDKDAIDYILDKFQKFNNLDKNNKSKYLTEYNNNLALIKDNKKILENYIKYDWNRDINNFNKLDYKYPICNYSLNTILGNNELPRSIFNILKTDNIEKSDCFYSTAQICEDLIEFNKFIPNQCVSDWLKYLPPPKFRSNNNMSNITYQNLIDDIKNNYKNFYQNNSNKNEYFSPTNNDYFKNLNSKITYFADYTEYINQNNKSDNKTDNKLIPIFNINNLFYSKNNKNKILNKYLIDLINNNNILNFSFLIDKNNINDYNIFQKKLLKQYFNTSNSILNNINYINDSIPQKFYDINDEEIFMELMDNLLEPYTKSIEQFKSINLDLNTIGNIDDLVELLFNMNRIYKINNSNTTHKMITQRYINKFGKDYKYVPNDDKYRLLIPKSILCHCSYKLQKSFEKFNNNNYYDYDGGINRELFDLYYFGLKLDIDINDYKTIIPIRTENLEVIDKKYKNINANLNRIIKTKNNIIRKNRFDFEKFNNLTELDDILNYLETSFLIVDDLNNYFAIIQNLLNKFNIINNDKYYYLIQEIINLLKYNLKDYHEYFTNLQIIFINIYSKINENYDLLFDIIINKDTTIEIDLVNRYFQKNKIYNKYFIGEERFLISNLNIFNTIRRDISSEIDFENFINQKNNSIEDFKLDKPIFDSYIKYLLYSKLYIYDKLELIEFTNNVSVIDKNNNIIRLDLQDPLNIELRFGREIFNNNYNKLYLYCLNKLLTNKFGKYNIEADNLDYFIDIISYNSNLLNNINLEINNRELSSISNNKIESFMELLIYNLLKLKSDKMESITYNMINNEYNNNNELLISNYDFYETSSITFLNDIIYTNSHDINTEYYNGNNKIRKLYNSYLLGKKIDDNINVLDTLIIDEEYINKHIENADDKKKYKKLNEKQKLLIQKELLIRNDGIDKKNGTFRGFYSNDYKHNLKNSNKNKELEIDKYGGNIITNEFIDKVVNELSKVLYSLEVSGYDNDGTDDGNYTKKLFEIDNKEYKSYNEKIGENSAYHNKWGVCGSKYLMINEEYRIEWSKKLSYALKKLRDCIFNESILEDELENTTLFQTYNLYFDGKKGKGKFDNNTVKEYKPSEILPINQNITLINTTKFINNFTYMINKAILERNGKKEMEKTEYNILYKNNDLIVKYGLDKEENKCDVMPELDINSLLNGEINEKYNIREYISRYLNLEIENFNEIKNLNRKFRVSSGITQRITPYNIPSIFSYKIIYDLMHNYELLYEIILKYFKNPNKIKKIINYALYSEEYLEEYQKIQKNMQNILNNYEKILNQEKIGKEDKDKQEYLLIQLFDYYNKYVKDYDEINNELKYDYNDCKRRYAKLREDFSDLSKLDADEARAYLNSKNEIEEDCIDIETELDNEINKKVQLCRLFITITNEYIKKYENKNKKIKELLIKFRKICLDYWYKKFNKNLEDYTMTLNEFNIVFGYEYLIRNGYYNSKFYDMLSDKIFIYKNEIIKQINDKINDKKEIELYVMIKKNNKYQYMNLFDDNEKIDLNKIEPIILAENNNKLFNINYDKLKEENKKINKTNKINKKEILSQLLKNIYMKEDNGINLDKKDNKIYNVDKFLKIVWKVLFNNLEIF